MSEYQLERRAQFDTPEAILFALIARGTGLSPLRREQIVRGTMNEVYRVTTQQGPRLIARIGRHDEVSFAQQAWALDQCRQRAIPVPEVLLLNSIAVGSQTLPILVQRELPGEPLVEIAESLGSERLSTILARAGEVLRRLHSIAVGGFYRRHDDGGWDFPTWESVMDSAISGRRTDAPWLAQVGFTAADIDFMLAAMERCRREFAAATPVLTHGDFGPDHLLVDRDGAIGLIDFGEFQGAAALHDFAYFSFNAPTLDLDSLRRGYGHSPALAGDFALKLDLYKVGLQMGYLAHNVRAQNTEQARFEAEQLRATLASLRARNPSGAM